MKQPLGALVTLLAALPAIGLAQNRPLEMKWGELAPMLTGHRVTLTLSNGIGVKGEAVAVREDAMLVDVSSAVDGYPRGSGSVPRNSIILIDLQRSKGAWGRTLGTLIGVLGGMALGVYVDARNLWGISGGEAAGIVVGTSAGGALAGYFTGRAIDKRVTHIKVVP